MEKSYKTYFRPEKDDKGQIIRKNSNKGLTIRFAGRPKFILESIMNHERKMHPEWDEEKLNHYSSMMYLYFLKRLEECNGSPFVMYGKTS